MSPFETRRCEIHFSVYHIKCPKAVEWRSVSGIEGRVSYDVDKTILDLTPFYHTPWRRARKERSDDTPGSVRKGYNTEYYIRGWVDGTFSEVEHKVVPFSLAPVALLLTVVERNRAWVVVSLQVSS